MLYLEREPPSSALVPTLLVPFEFQQCTTEFLDTSQQQVSLNTNKITDNSTTVCVLGIVSIKGHFPYCYSEKFKDSLVVGPMTRYAKDLRLMLKVLVGDKQASNLKLNQKVSCFCAPPYHLGKFFC